MTSPDRIERSPFQPERGETKPAILVRNYRDGDMPKMAEIMRANFDGPSFTLFPKDVVDGYKAANRIEDITHAMGVDGTEVFIAETEKGEVGGFCLIRHNQFHRREAYGDLDLRRLHVNPNIQGQGIGKRLFDIVLDRARELNTEYVTSHASGGSRPFFEENGWSGVTILNDMNKRGTSALVFAAQRRVLREVPQEYPEVKSIVYAGANPTRESFINELVHQSGYEIPVVGVPVEEDPGDDVLVVAKSKVDSALSQISPGQYGKSIIVASDVRTDILLAHQVERRTRYMLVNKGKPRSMYPLDEVQDLFSLMLDTSKRTKRPVPYIVRSATYIHDMQNPERNLSSEYDTSIWLSQEGLEVLSSDEGFRDYREQVIGEYHTDVTSMAGGFALPVFLKRGYVVGMQGYPFDKLARQDKIKGKALHTAIVGVDGDLLNKRLEFI